MYKDQLFNVFDTDGHARGACIATVVAIGNNRFICVFLCQCLIVLFQFILAVYSKFIPDFIVLVGRCLA